MVWRFHFFAIMLWSMHVFSQRETLIQTPQATLIAPKRRTLRVQPYNQRHKRRRTTDPSSHPATVLSPSLKPASNGHRPIAQKWSSAWDPGQRFAPVANPAAMMGKDFFPRIMFTYGNPGIDGIPRWPGYGPTAYAKRMAGIAGIGGVGRECARTRLRKTLRSRHFPGILTERAWQRRAGSNSLNKARLNRSRAYRNVWKDSPVHENARETRTRSHL